MIDTVVIRKITWKSETTDAYVTALLRAAMDLHDRGVIYFNNDDVPEENQPGDKTTVGASFRLLMVAGIIEPWYGFVPEDEIFGGRRRSSRACNNGHKNQLYSLVNTGLAAEWLERHGTIVEPSQMSLF